MAARPTQLTTRNPGTLELNPMPAAKVEQAVSAEGDAALGAPGPTADSALDPRYA